MSIRNIATVILFVVWMIFEIQLHAEDADQRWVSSPTVPDSFKIAYRDQMTDWKGDSACKCASKFNPVNVKIPWECGRYRAKVRSSVMETYYWHGKRDAKEAETAEFYVGIPNIKSDNTFPLFGLPCQYLEDTVTRQKGGGRKGDVFFRVIEAQGDLANPMRNRLAIPIGGSMTRLCPIRDSRNGFPYGVFPRQIQIEEEKPSVLFTVKTRYLDQIPDSTEIEQIYDLKCEKGQTLTIPEGRVKNRDGTFTVLRKQEEFKVHHIQMPDAERKIAGWVVLDPLFEGPAEFRIPRP